MQDVSLSTSTSLGCVQVHGVSLSTASSMDVQGVSLSTATSMDVHCAGCIPFHRQQYGGSGCIPFPPPAVWTCRVYSCPSLAVRKCRVYVCVPFHPCKVFLKSRNAGLSGIRSVRYQSEQKCRCWNQSSTGIRGHSLVPDLDTG